MASSIAMARVAARASVATKALRSANVVAAPVMGARSLRTSVVSKAYDSESKGTFETEEFRISFTEGGKTISPWHDVPLKNADGTYNFICEIPKETAAKMEVATDEPSNPIKQDIKKGAVRFYPYNINWNYGMLPQTWEDPGHKNEDAGGVFGDNDPVDVVEIGAAALGMGSIHSVKVLGVLAMIDDGELDWKVIAINSADAKFDAVNDVEDVEREFPGEIEKIRVWFRDYKIPDGKPANAYGFNDECLNAEFTKAVIEETSGFYQSLMKGDTKNEDGLWLN